MVKTKFKQKSSKILDTSDASSDENDGIGLTMEDRLEMEAVGVKPARKAPVEFINKHDELLAKAAELDLDAIAGVKLAWIEKLEVVSDKPIVLADVHNDLARELSFYQQALDAVKQAKLQIKQVGVAFERPNDYFAEMVKSDEHMVKIREKLVEEAEGMKKSEEAKKMREMKKFGKKVQIEKLQQRQQEKTRTLEKLNELKRKRKNNPGDGLDDEDFDIALEDGDSNHKKGGKKNLTNPKRQKKNEKYGHGGPKKRGKSNTAESTDDFNFSWKKNKRLPKGMKGAGKQKQNRPGKMRRQKMRNKV